MSSKRAAKAAVETVESQEERAARLKKKVSALTSSGPEVEWGDDEVTDIREMTLEELRAAHDQCMKTARESIESYTSRLKPTST